MPRLISLGGAIALVALVLALATSCRGSLSNEDCLKLLDRYTDFLVREENPDVPAERVAELKEKARVAASTDARFEFGECSRKVSRGSFECAMQAVGVDAMERCLVF